MFRPKGRKRWGLNMAVKSGSLKSTKSDKSADGEESRNSSGRGMGAIMLANLHGLTRYRVYSSGQGVTENMTLYFLEIN